MSKTVLEVYRETREATLPQNIEAPGEAPSPGMAWIPGGTFLMGSNDFYPEERPVHRVAVDSFWMDRHLVTNEQFALFVRETGYVTVAEKPPSAEDYPGAEPELLVPGSMVFHRAKEPVDLGNWMAWWRWTPGACWRRPKGPGSSIRDFKRHPVVHVAYEDVEAYARWAGKEIPSEAEWERAARGGLEGAAFTWGDEHLPNGRILANTWQGEFPWRNTLADGYLGTSPVGSFPANGYGLYDMAGNVWEWTSDWYTAAHAADPGKPCCTPTNPRGASREGSYDTCQPNIRIPRKVLKGGSHLCAPNYCLRYRPAARSPQMVDTGMAHIGFRCIVRVQAAQEA
jgi:formylglycine-generating enzyme required for sulfatase activity